jgi:zinc protease
VVERRGLGVAGVNLVIASGSASDGPKPGVARVTAELMRAGGAGVWSAARLEQRLRSAGGALQVVTSPDVTQLSVTVPSTELEAALGILAALASRPRLSLWAFGKLRQAHIERARSSARHDPVWATLWVLHRELYALPTQVHPYGIYDATAAELEQITLEDCRQWHRTHVTPQNARLLVAGDARTETVVQAAAQAFATWKGQAPPEPSCTDPLPPTRLQVHLVDHPGAPYARVCAGLLGPTGWSAELVAWEAIAYLLGDPALGSLPRALVEQAALADSATAELVYVEHGPIPMVLCAQTDAARAAPATQALLTELGRMREQALTLAETRRAAQVLSSRMWTRSESVQGLAELYSWPGLLRSREDRFHQQQHSDPALEIGTVQRVVQAYLSAERSVLAVAADAKRLQHALSRFGPVSVLDAEQGLVIRTRLPHDPAAPLHDSRPEKG